jgi:hypothetical protein
MDLASLITILICLFPLIPGIIAFMWRRKKIKRILREFENEDWEVRVRAVRQAHTFLEKDTDNRIVGLLIRALQDQNSSVRLQAAEIFEHMKRLVARSSMKSLAIGALINALKDEHPHVRKYAAGALGKTDDPYVIESLIKTLSDADRGVRNHAVFALMDRDNVHAIKPLLRLLKSEDRDAVLTALKPLCKLVRKIVFGDNQVVIFEPEYTLRNPYVSNLTVPMPELREIVIYTTTCDIRHIEAFTNYVSGYIGEEQLKKRIGLSIHGELGKFPSDFFKVFSACKQVDVDIETVIFAKAIAPAYNLFRAWQNPDSSELTLPLSHLKQIVVDSETYNFHLVERFLTYAIDHIGQDYLKKNVDVHIYGDPKKLHQNLRNNFTNLCKNITVHKV